MRKRIIFLLALASLSSCSQFSKQRLPASESDVGIIGPKGQTLLYYKKGEHIAVKRCAPNTILGSTTADGRLNCQGKENLVPVEVFKKELRTQLLGSKLSILNPLTKEEAEIYVNSAPISVYDIEDLSRELDRINRFIELYGKENADLERRDKIIEYLKNRGGILLSAVKKINNEIDFAISRIVNESELTLLKASTDEANFLFKVLSGFAPKDLYACGYQGSIQQRINDCNYQENASKGNFKLVRRDPSNPNRLLEIYQDSKTGLLWSELREFSNFQAARESCAFYGSRINESGWRLPTKEEYVQAFESGIHKSLSRMDEYYWSSSIFIKQVMKENENVPTGMTWIFNGVSGEISEFPTGIFEARLAVRCVQNP